MTRAVYDEAKMSQSVFHVARELHDVVAHHVSAVAVQAVAARLPEERSAIVDAVGHMTDSARRIATAVPDLVLVAPEHDVSVLDGDIVRDIVEPARQAGGPVALEVHGEPAHPAGEADLLAQRVLVEGLANVVRHAGASPTAVRLHQDRTGITVSMVDSGPVLGHRPPALGSGLGLGLVGMRERVRAPRRLARDRTGRRWRVVAGPRDVARPDV